MMNASVSYQVSNAAVPKDFAFDPLIDYELLFEQNMRVLEGYHETAVDQLQDEFICMNGASLAFILNGGIQSFLVKMKELQQAYNNVWASLRSLKSKWLFYQRHASLAIPVSEIFSTSRPSTFWDHFQLRTKSMMIEWPNIFKLYESQDPAGITVDRAPLIHMSRRTAYVRRRYPTVQLSVLALNKNTSPTIVQCRARVVTESVNRMEMDTYGMWRPVGKLMNVKREGEMQHTSFPYEEENEALLANCGQQQPRPLQFDTCGTLTVPFCEIGVNTAGNRAASHLVRYRVEMHCQLRFANGVEIENTLLSHPFLIAANKDKNTVVLGDMAWEILATKSMNPTISPRLLKVRWGDLRNFLRYSVQSQLPAARPLDSEELLHLQCMLFLPLAVDHPDLKNLENYLFESETERNDMNKQGIKKIKYRLLRENVRDNVEIEHRLFLQNKCISMKDGEMELSHSVWEWLYEAIDMIADPDPAHLICEDLRPPIPGKKKSKSSMMLELFNDKLITMSSRNRVWKVYKSLYRYDARCKRAPTKAMLIHFCDETAGHITIHYSNDTNDLKPTFGNLSATQVKSYDRGLVGMLMEGAWPSKFDRLVMFNTEREEWRNDTKDRATFLMKKHVFNGFEPKTHLQPIKEKSELDLLQHDAEHGPTESVKRPDYFPPFSHASTSSCNSPPEDPDRKQFIVGDIDFITTWH